MRRKLLLAVLLAGTALFAGEPILITHPDNAVTTISAKDLERIYANKKRRWPDGARIVPVTLQHGATHQSFLEVYLNKSERQFSIFWKRLLFTGRGVPPTSFASEEEVVAFVAATPGAIGYVSLETRLAGVKPLGIRGDDR